MEKDGVIYSRLDPKSLSKQDISRIEEAMNTEDLEVMVAVVDSIVTRTIARVSKNLRPTFGPINKGGR